MRLSGCRNIFRHHPALIEWGCWRLFFPIAPINIWPTNVAQGVVVKMSKHGCSEWHEEKCHFKLIRSLIPHTSYHSHPSHPSQILITPFHSSHPSHPSPPFHSSHPSHPSPPFHLSYSFNLLTFLILLTFLTCHSFLISLTFLISLLLISLFLSARSAVFSPTLPLNTIIPSTTLASSSTVIIIITYSHAHISQ